MIKNTIKDKNNPQPAEDSHRYWDSVATLCYAMLRHAMLRYAFKVYNSNTNTLNHSGALDL